MLSPQANLRLLQRTSWSGFVCIAFLMAGIWPLAGFFPSQPPSWNAAQITRVYHDNTMGIRIGMVLVLVGSMFYVPWTAMLAKLIAAVEGKPGILTYFWIWFFVMTYTIRRSLHRLDDVSAVSAPSVRAV
jgi:hypothetical protein